jgi:glycosyltransferase involved in cell wall biosynthesis
VQDCKLKITFLSPVPNLSGGERVVAIYARELARMGNDVEVVCSRQQRVSLKRQLMSLVKGRGWPRQPQIGVSHYADYGIRYRIVDHDGALTDRDIENSDAVIATYWLTAEWVERLSSEKGQKFYLVQHDEGTIHKNMRAENTYTFDMFHIYVSDWIADRIRQRHPDSRGTVINNAIEVDLFDLGPREKPSRLRVGMMWAGETIKGGDIAVEAVRLAKERGLDIETVAFGSNRPPKKYAGEFSEFFLQPKQNTLVEIYRSCSVWLFTSRFEGFGLPILEAMASGTPVIGTPTGAAPELIAQGGGFQVGMEDVDAVASAIEKIAAMDAAEWKCMSQSAQKTARSHTWQTAAKSLELFLNQCLEN